MKTKAEELKQKIIERLDESFNNYWHSTTDLIKDKLAKDILNLINECPDSQSHEVSMETEALNDKIIRLLKDKHDSFLGIEGQKSRDDFKAGLLWAINTIETCTKQADFEEVARQLMKHLGNGQKYHPHHTAIITNDGAELVEGVLSTGHVFDYIPD